MKTLAGPGPVTLSLRKNIADSVPKLQEAIEIIKTVCNIDIFESLPRTHTQSNAFVFF